MPGGKGYWLVLKDGAVLSAGMRYLYGSMSGKDLGSPVVGMAATPDGHGYWIVTSKGGVFGFGDAHFYGSTGDRSPQPADRGHGGHPRRPRLLDGRLRRRCVRFRRRPRFTAHRATVHLNRPIVGMAATPDGRGYWMVASDGGVFGFGDAPFFGSTGDRPPQPADRGHGGHPRRPRLLDGRLRRRCVRFRRRPVFRLTGRQKGSH